MKKIYRLTDKFTKFFYLFIFFVTSILLPNVQIVNAYTMDNLLSQSIVEELRLRVPSEFKEVWIRAEKKIWEPWLSIQDGFLGREIFWDKDKEEALILVNWQSKKLWKSIPMSEVNVVQQKFEDDVKAALNVNENPFELIYEGELDKQG